MLITFADLKKYRYWYWCGFPALLQKPGWETLGGWHPVDVHEVRLPLRFTLRYPNVGMFQLSEIQVYQAQSSLSPAVTLAKSSSGGLTFGPLSSFTTFFSHVPDDEVSTAASLSFYLHTLTKFIAQRSLIFVDPSSHPSAPGWPLRNVLSYLSLSSTSLPVKSIRIIALRDGEDARVGVVRIKLDGGVVEEGERKKPSVVGWEKNEKGKLAPRMADLAPLMDPVRFVLFRTSLNLTYKKTC